MAASSVYPAYDVPLRLARTLRRSVRRAGLTRRFRLVPGCPLLGLRARHWARSSSARGSLAFEWRLPTERDGIVHTTVANPPAPRRPQERGTQPRALRQTIVEPPQPAPTSALAALPDWTRVPRNAGRRARRQMAASGPLLGAQMVPSRMVHRQTPNSIATREQSQRSSGPATTPARTALLEQAYTRDVAASDAGVRQESARASQASVSLGARVSRRGRGDASRGGLASSAPLALRPLTWHPASLTAVWPRVAQLVQREVTRQVPGAVAGHTPADAARPVPVQPVTHDGDRGGSVSERLVVQVMHRLKALAREERFRAGHLR